MTNTKAIPQGISIIYFNEPHRNIYAEMPQNKEQAKRFAKRIYRDAMSDISSNQHSCDLLLNAMF